MNVKRADSPTLWIVPAPAGTEPQREICEWMREAIQSATVYFVESLPRAKAWLSRLRAYFSLTPPDEEVFYVLEEWEKSHLMTEVRRIFLTERRSACLLSDAGYPGWMDPGGLLIRWAHYWNVRVRVVPGSSALTMATVVSGFPAQSWFWYGYLPREFSAFRRQLRALVEISRRWNAGVFWIEVPHRTLETFHRSLQILPSSVLFSVAVALLTSREWIGMRPVVRWKRWMHAHPEILEQWKGQPAVFGLYAGE